MPDDSGAVCLHIAIDMSIITVAAKGLTAARRDEVPFGSVSRNWNTHAYNVKTRRDAPGTDYNHEHASTFKDRSAPIILPGAEGNARI